MKHQAVVKMIQTNMGKMILLALFWWTSAVANSSVAKGGLQPSHPIALKSMQNTQFLLLLRPIFALKTKIASQWHWR